MPNDTVRHILARTSIRKFDLERPVPREHMRVIIDAMRAAPSSRFNQSLDFHCFTDAHDIARRAAMTHDKLFEVAPGLRARMEESGVIDPIFYQAGFVVFILARSREETERNASYKIDTGMAAQNAMIAAQSLGLRSIPIGIVKYFEEEVFEAFELPREKVLVLAVAVGYPAEPDHTPKPRRDDSVFGLE